MDDKINDSVLSAFRENRLAAVHIDLIDFCFEPATAQAFKGVRENAALMRSLGIPNIWVTYDGTGQPLDTPVTTVAAIDNDPENRISSLVGALDDEIVAIKDEISAFELKEPTGLSLILDQLKADMILIDGVYTGGCVSSTISHGLLRDKYNFLAMPNGMNWLPAHGPNPNYLSIIRKHCENYQSLKLPNLDSRLFTGTPESLTKLLGTKPLLATGSRPQTFDF